MNLILKPNFIRLARTHVNLRHEFLPIKPGLFVNIKLPEITAEPCPQERTLGSMILPNTLPPFRRKYQHRF